MKRTSYDDKLMRRVCLCFYVFNEITLSFISNYFIRNLGLKTISLYIKLQGTTYRSKFLINQKDSNDSTIENEPENFDFLAKRFYWVPLNRL